MIGVVTFLQQLGRQQNGSPMNAMGVPSGHSTWNFVKQHPGSNLTTPMGSLRSDSTFMTEEVRRGQQAQAYGRRRWITSSRFLLSSSTDIWNALNEWMTIEVNRYEPSSCLSRSLSTNDIRNALIWMGNNWLKTYHFMQCEFIWYVSKCIDAPLNTVLSKKIWVKNPTTVGFSVFLCSVGVW